MAISHQPSHEIRDFLILYLLERAAEGGFAPEQLGPEVVRRSEGDLQPAEDDVRSARVTCWEHGWLEGDQTSGRAPVSLSPDGRRELERRLETARRESGVGDPREAAADRVVSWVSGSGDCEVLDVGTGGGFLAEKLAAAGRRVLGVDSDAEAIARATADHGAGPALRFEMADIRTLAEQRRRWRVIVTAYMLHECEDPIAALHAICSCLEPGGRLVSMDFAPNSAAYVAGAGRTRFHAFRALAQNDWVRLAPRLRLTQLEFAPFGYVAVTSARKRPAGHEE